MGLSESELDAVFSAHFDLSTTNILGKEPEKEHLLRFIRGGMATKRLRKKFLKDPDRYAKRVNNNIWKEWRVKRFWKTGKAMAECIRETMSRTSAMSLLFPKPEENT
jgi:hypothetical protein